MTWSAMPCAVSIEETRTCKKHERQSCEVKLLKQGNKPYMVSNLVYKRRKRASCARLSHLKRVCIHTEDMNLQTLGPGCVHGKGICIASMWPCV